MRRWAVASPREAYWYALSARRALASGGEVNEQFLGVGLPANANSSRWYLSRRAMSRHFRRTGVTEYFAGVARITPP